MRSFLILLSGLVFMAAALAGLTFLVTVRAPGPDGSVLQLQRTPWADLPGWPADGLGAALTAFSRSCDGILNRPVDRPMGGANLPDGRAVYGAAGDWVQACAAAKGTDPVDADARALFERVFRPVRIVPPKDDAGLFTGYFEPELDGSLAADAAHTVPLYARPDDLVSVDLGAFRDSLKGQRIAGRVEGGALIPYETRAQIEDGALEGRARVLAYVSDPVDAAFLHVQGSGRVRLANGDVLRVGYDGQNGHKGTLIGRVLIDRGYLERGSVTMRSIRDWLAANPDKRDDILRANAAYIFFRDLKIADPALGPIGAEGVSLTPLHSLAVDRMYHALGVPMWVDTTKPGGEEALRTLTIAQDTGGAIVGPVRGDIFFGFGGDAPQLAGAMQQPGALTILLPVTLADRLLKPASAAAR